MEIIKESELESIFKDRISIHSLKVNHLEKKSAWFSLLRIIIGISIICCITIAIKWNVNWQVFVLIFLQIIGFVFLIFQHKKIEIRTKFHSSICAINQHEINCLSNNLGSNYNGSEFIDPNHPYTSDLDIFGKSSLYQFICRAGSRGGRERLALWLQKKVSAQTILQRQTASKSLSGDLDWRQNLQAFTSELSNKTKLTEKLPVENIDMLDKWLLEKPFLISIKYFLFFITVLQLSTLVLLILVIVSFPFKYLLIPAIINAIILKKFSKEIFSLRTKTSQHSRFLKTYSSILKLIEHKQFNDPYSIELQRNLHNPGSVASLEITRLDSYLYNLESTQNPYFYPIGNLLFSSDVYWVYQLEQWKLKNKDNVKRWFDIIYEFEAISSIAAINFLKPSWAFPIVTDTDFYISTQELTHPLIASSRAIPNNITVQGAGKCVVITGSNMSGKSTFLRTLGINSVLAYAGAPVAARNFSIGPSALFTSMRTQDSLEENTSSFYAELKRLKSLLEKLNNTTVTFYLLDEILKGTNSGDRQNGAKALITQLNNSNATGLISTHDLQLGELEKRNPEKIFNYSFNSSLKNGKLSFDYKLHPGICNSFNASDLMAQIGIKFDPQ